MTDFLLRIIGFVALLFALAGSTAFAVLASDQLSLAKIEEKVTVDYPAIKQLPLTKMQDWIREKRPVLIFDVREEQEFEVGHIGGAIRVDPSIWASQFFANYGDRLKGKNLIFYCSVGVRSSKLASYLRKELIKRGAVSVANLRGGIFAWANQANRMENRYGATRLVHPFSDYWGQLIADKTRWSYRAKAGQ